MGQEMQAVAAACETVPALQIEQEPKPEEPPKYPLAQFMHTEAPAPE